MTAPDVRVGDVWERPGPESSIVSVRVEQVCPGGWAAGCPDAYKGAHAHVVTLPKGNRRRAVLLRRFGGRGGQSYQLVSRGGESGG